MVAINAKTIYALGNEYAQIDCLAAETPDAMPETTDEILGVKQGVGVFAGSTVWCADTGKKWILFDDANWYNTADTSDVFGGGGGE